MRRRCGSPSDGAQVANGHASLARLPSQRLVGAPLPARMPRVPVVELRPARGPSVDRTTSAPTGRPIRTRTLPERSSTAARGGSRRADREGSCASRRRVMGRPFCGGVLEPDRSSVRIPNGRKLMPQYCGRAAVTRIAAAPSRLRSRCDQLPRRRGRCGCQTWLCHSRRGGVRLQHPPLSGHVAAERPSGAGGPVPSPKFDVPSPGRRPTCGRWSDGVPARSRCRTSDLQGGGVMSHCGSRRRLRDRRR